MIRLMCSWDHTSFTYHTYNFDTDMEAIEKFYHDKIYVWDCDYCSDHDHTYYFAVHSGDYRYRYYQLDHSYYIETDPEWEVVNVYDIKLVDKELTKGLTADRDWLIVGNKIGLK